MRCFWKKQCRPFAKSSNYAPLRRRAHMSDWRAQPRFEENLHRTGGAQAVHSFAVRAPRGSVWDMGDIIRKKKNGRDLGRYIRWTENGKRRQRASHQTSYALAKRMLLEIEARVARGMVGIVEPDARQQITVAELCARFLQEYSSPRVKNLARYRQYAASRLRRAAAHRGSAAQRAW